uniref:Uncharacterized protein n=1 Tax=Romanomermis culicivorax TaxID=13658 RepID=A0A915JNP7_ROMCU
MYKRNCSNQDGISEENIIDQNITAGLVELDKIITLKWLNEESESFSKKHLPVQFGLSVVDHSRQGKLVYEKRLLVYQISMGGLKLGNQRFYNLDHYLWV